MTEKNNLFRISKEITERYQDLKIGLVVGRELVNKDNDERLEKMTRAAEAKIRERLNLDSLSSHPHVSAWRDTYRSFGVNPKKYAPTCEAIVRRVLNGETVPIINVIVNSYLLAEIEYLLPCGGYDIDKLEGNINLRYSSGNEEFIPIGGKENEFTKAGEIVYSDSKRILTRKWNYRDSDATKIATESRNIILFSEAPVRNIETEALDGFLKRLSGLLISLCGGSVEYDVIEFKNGDKG